MPIDLALISQLLGPHPARRMAFDELSAGLARGVAAKTINVSRDGDLELFGYSSFCQFEQKWDLFSLISRGLILDRQSRQVVATPFPKFFNFGEGSIPVPDEPFEASEKIDGSLGILFHHQHGWRATTRGQLQSIQGQWATAFLHNNVDTGQLNVGTTYLVEIVYPENRIVIPYGFSGLVLLGGYDSQGFELDRQALQDAAGRAGMRIAGLLPGSSFDDLIQRAKGLSRFEEGYVVRFQNGLRLKVKGEAYCRAHKLICQCTPLALWEVMQTAGDLDAMRIELPEEMRRDFDTIRRMLDERFEKVLADIREAKDRFAALTDKELGLHLQTAGATLTEAQRKFIFAARKPGFFEDVRRRGENRERVFRLIRPDGNLLPGYVPSDAMNRFAQESG